MLDEQLNPENLWDPRNSVALLETTVLWDSEKRLLERFPSSSRENLEARKNHEIDELAAMVSRRADLLQELRNDVSTAIRGMETKWRIPPTGMPLAYTSVGGDDEMSLREMRPGTTGKQMPHSAPKPVEIYDRNGVRRLVPGDDLQVKEACENHARLSLAERIQGSPWWKEISPRERKLLQKLTAVSSERLVDPVNTVDPDYPRVVTQ